VDKLLIAGKSYGSRLLIGTGKYRDFAQTRAAVEASGAEIVTVAIRRTNIGQNANEPSCSTATTSSSWKCSAIRTRCTPTCPRR
jgi:thiazole synthase